MNRRNDIAVEVTAWAAALLLFMFAGWLVWSVFNTEAKQPTPASKYYDLSFPNGEEYSCAVSEQTITCDYYEEQE